MDLKDFTEKEQEQIKKGLSTAVLTDEKAAKEILALVPEEWIKTFPFLSAAIRQQKRSTYRKRQSRTLRSRKSK